MPLALANDDHLSPAINVCGTQVRYFRDAQPGGIDRGENRAMFEIVGGLKGGDLRLTQDGGEPSSRRG